jgi:hypothetical protein
VPLADEPRLSRSLCGICRDKPRPWKLDRLGVTGLATARSSFDTFIDSRIAGDGESVGLGASERDRVLDGDWDMLSVPLCRVRVEGVGVWSRLFCSSACVKDEAALEGGAGTTIADISQRMSAIEKDGGSGRWHDWEFASTSLREGHVQYAVSVMSCYELYPQSSSPHFKPNKRLLALTLSQRT